MSRRISLVNGNNNSIHFENCNFQMGNLPIGGITSGNAYSLLPVPLQIEKQPPMAGLDLILTINFMEPLAEKIACLGEEPLLLWLMTLYFSEGLENDTQFDYFPLTGTGAPVESHNLQLGGDCAVDQIVDIILPDSEEWLEALYNQETIGMEISQSGLSQSAQVSGGGLIIVANSGAFEPIGFETSELEAILNAAI